VLVLGLDRERGIGRQAGTGRELDDNPHAPVDEGDTVLGCHGRRISGGRDLLEGGVQARALSVATHSSRGSASYQAGRYDAGDRHPSQHRYAIGRSAFERGAPAESCISMLLASLAGSTPNILGRRWMAQYY
jgi:hypothetical protein